jgi:hypothetical protein
MPSCYCLGNDTLSAVVQAKMPYLLLYGYRMPNLLCSGLENLPIVVQSRILYLLCSDQDALPAGKGVLHERLLHGGRIAAE